MHLTLKQEATKPPAFNFLQQQERFDAFIDQYNNDRPQQALDMKYPGELYTPSPRVFRAPPPSPMCPGRTQGIWLRLLGSNQRPAD